MNDKALFLLKLKNWQQFYGSFSSVDDVVCQFEIDESELNGAHVLLASYQTESYEGAAFVLFLRDNQLYEVNGGHCSCYGLEGQWAPEETSEAELIHRIKKGSLGTYLDGDDFGQDLLKVLE